MLPNFIKYVPESETASVLLASHENSRLCEHDDCHMEAVYQDYCDEHAEYYFCECGTRLEDASGTPGDGFCRRCQ